MSIHTGTATRAREHARRTNGQFGTQWHSDPGTVGVDFDSDPVRTVNEDGTQMWTVDGQLHRLEGPAVIRPDGVEEFWVDGRLLNGEDLMPGYLPDDEPPF